MKMWAVIQGCEYEGENFGSLRLFHDTIRGKAAAEEYAKQCEKGVVNYSEIELIEVEQ
jgi:hypothetical protein